MVEEINRHEMKYVAAKRPVTMITIMTISRIAVMDLTI